MDFLSELSNNVPLVNPVFKLANFKEKISTKENWTSSPFLAFDGGYQLCLKVYPAGIGRGAGTYVSVGVYLMKSPHDDKLQRSGHWPVKGNFSVQLLYPQRLNRESIIKMMFASKINAFELFKISDVKDIHRVTHSGMVKIGGNDQFMSHADLTRYTVGNSGNLYLRVLYNEDEFTFRDVYGLLEQLSTHQLHLQHALVPLHLGHSGEINDQVAPAILQLSRFSTMTIGTTWYSSPLFAFVGGYQVCLKVLRVKDCLISSELFLMKGPHDDKLQKFGMWPMKGMFTVKLFGNNKYCPHIYTPPDEERCSKCFEQVTTDDMANEGFGFSLFTLDSSCTEPDFFTEDALFFEVLYNKGTAF